MVEAVRDLWRPSAPTPLLKQGQLEQIALDHVQLSFGYVQGRRLHNGVHSLETMNLGQEARLSDGCELACACTNQNVQVF